MREVVATSLFFLSVVNWFANKFLFLSHHNLQIMGGSYVLL